MLPKKKNYHSIADSENLLQEFYENLEDDTFLGHSFIGKMMLRNMKPRLFDSNIEQVVVVEPIDEVEFFDEVKAVPRKQKFFNLDDVLNLENYDILPEQELSQFHCTDSKGQFTMIWNTKSQYQSGRALSRNILRPGPHGPSRNVTDPLEAFRWFITDDMLNDYGLLHHSKY